MLGPDSPLVERLHPSPNIEPRRGKGANGPDLLLLHYTGMRSCEKAIWWLAEPRSRVSCHYVIDIDGTVTQMVPESMRAWHAGASCWAGETDINSRSIGFEIHNPGHDDGYPPFPEAQMQAVIALARDVVGRHGIAPERVLAHSDVAPARKHDPGEKFDWQRLAAADVGLWVPPAPVDAADVGLGLDSAAPLIAEVQTRLARYGYLVPASGVLDLATTQVVAAFQRHFRPARVDGAIDASTIATLDRLLDVLGATQVPIG